MYIEIERDRERCTSTVVPCNFSNPSPFICKPTCQPYNP